MFTPAGKTRDTVGNERGFAMIIALLLIVVVTGYLFTLHHVSAGGMRSSEFNARKIRANYLAEGGCEAVQKMLQRALANYTTPPGEGAVTVDGIAVYYTVQQIGLQRIHEDEVGVRTIVQPYMITTSVVFEGTVSSVERVVDAGLTPIFQYAVFYTEDLEMLPGPNLTLTGRVHSNNDIYIGSHSTLTIDSNYLRAVGSLYLRRKNDGTLMNGTVRVKVKGTESYFDFEQRSDLDAMGVPSVSGFDSDFRGYDINGDGDFLDEGEMNPWVTRSQELWSGTTKTGEHGLKEIVPPSVQTLKAYVEGGSGKGFFHENAGLAIRDNQAFLGEINVTSSLPSGTITEKMMYDGRENKYITVTEIDMEKLGSSGYFPSNGLLYAYRSDADAEHPNGIRLKNAEELAAPLTMVSENPVYTLGDYNKTNKKPASIITDAMNILSNNWNDTKFPGYLPNASETTINAAFITGNLDTQWGAYNGGLENLPRFHERWSGVPCNIRGSFVNTFISDVGQGQWVYGGDNYEAPVRNWDYDTDFNDFNKLPPFTPYVVVITRVVQTNK
ncbi:MAG: hypothetical protein ABIH04_02655 [Planctomycetota bacterium]